MRDPVAAYDRIAPQFARIAEERRAYLRGVEQAIVPEIPAGTRSLLDVGSGDGTRATRIAKTCGVLRVVLLEPSAEMRRQGPAGVEWWAMRAEELAGVDDQFDIILCLWNVLGHIDGRAKVVKNFSRLLAKDGLVFIDLNHRYNALHYGFARTMLRWAKDLLFRNERSGNVLATWNTAEGPVSTAGHVFTDREFRALVRQAGLEVRKRFAIDYATGQVRRWSFAGQLLYVLGKPSIT